MRELLCCKCGKNTVDPATDSAFIGVSANINVAIDDNRHSAEFLQEQLGKFKLNKNYVLCYECWFEAMGLVP